MTDLSNDQESSAQQNKIPVSPEYTKWRRLILNMPPQEALKNISDETYGILMDVGMGDNYGNFMAISMYVFHTGESSLKASSGGGVVGLGNMKMIIGLPQKIIKTAQSLIDLTKTADNLDYPKAQQVRFFFLTTSGVRAYECKIEDLRDGHPFFETFQSFTLIKSVADKIVTNPFFRLWAWYKVSDLWMKRLIGLLITVVSLVVLVFLVDIIPAGWLPEKLLPLPAVAAAVAAAAGMFQMLTGLSLLEVNSQFGSMPTLRKAGVMCLLLLLLLGVLAFFLKLLLSVPSAAGG